MRRQRQPLVGREPEIIGRDQFEAVDAIELEIGRQQAAFRLAADRQREGGQGKRGQAEQMELPAAEIHALAIRAIGDADRRDLPRRLLGAPLRIGDRAGGIRRLVELERAVGVALPALGRHAPALFQHDEHILDDAVLHRIGQLDRIAVGDVAFRVGDRDIAGGDDTPGLAVPHHLVGAQPIALPEHPHVGQRGDDVGVRIIFQAAGAELHLFGIVGLGRRRRQSRIAGGWRRDGAALQVLRMRRSGEQGRGERTAGQ